MQQAALAQTGKASFVDGLTTDSQQNLSVTQIEKEVLYQNALNSAQANGLQLGTALTQTQVSQLDRPMLWYVEQTVPDPNCTATATATCPTITALMPQVYLPANTSAMSAGGNISGQNVTLNFNQDGNGSILNTGSITAGGTLAVNTNSLTNQANQVDVGQLWSKVEGGYVNMTGTQVQPGGFMSAANMDLNVQTLQQVGGMLQQLNADGTVDQAGTQQLLANLQRSLGGNFTQISVSDNLHQDFVKEESGLPTIVVMALAVAASILTAGAAAAAMGVSLAEMTLGEAMLTAALSGVASSATSQLASGQGLDFGKVAEAGAVGAITAGLTNGITFDGSSFGVNGFDTVLKGTDSLANIAGSNTLGGALQAAQNGAVGTIGQQAVGMLGTALVGSAVNTVVYGGSFGQALEGSLVAQGAALGANEIGATTNPESLQNIVEHAALGCAVQSLSGGSCVGGAIGGATSAVATPLIGAVIVGQGAASPEQSAAITALAMLTGGGVASAFGQNALAAAGAAQNEALNNCTAHECWNNVKSALSSAVQSIGNWMATPEGMTTMLMVGTAGNTGEGLGGLPGGAVRTAVEESAVQYATRTVVQDATTAGVDAVANSGTTTLYRAVSPAEYSSIMKFGQFSFGPAGSEMKQFGFNLNEVLTFANFETDYAAIVKAEIPTNFLGSFNVSNGIDPFIFKSGVLTVNKSGLDLFNSIVTNIGHAY